jgi:hypothetical protein
MSEISKKTMKKYKKVVRNPSFKLNANVPINRETLKKGKWK